MIDYKRVKLLIEIIYSTGVVERGAKMGMYKKTVAKRVWVWFSADKSRWQVALTEEGFWHSPIGLGGKRLGEWERGLPPGLGPLLEWLQKH